MSPTTISIPPSVSAAEARLYLAMKLFEVQRLSVGQAADLAGYSKRAFMELLGKHGIHVIDYSTEDLQDDLSNT
jgi:predicted HTH domain antitoxin